MSKSRMQLQIRRSKKEGHMTDRLIASLVLGLWMFAADSMQALHVLI